MNNDKTNEQNVSVDASPEKEINSELQKRNMADHAIAELNVKYGSLILENIDDEVTLKRIHDARMEVKTVRVGVEKFCKQARDKSNAYSKAVIAEEKRIVALITPLELQLQAEEEKPEKEKERLRIEQEEKDAVRNQERIDLLIQNGMTFNSVAFFITGTSGITITLAELKNISDTQFDEFLLTVKTENEKEIARKKKEADDALALAQENARVKKEQDAIAEQQRKERELIAQEQKQIRDAKQKVRINLLLSLGMNQGQSGYEYKSIKISFSDVLEMSHDDFNKEVEMLKGRIATLKVSEKAAEEKRIADLAEQKIKDEQTRKENEEKERLRIAALAPDKEKLITFVNAFALIPLPDVLSDEANQILIEGAAMVAKARDFILNKVNNLK